MNDRFATFVTMECGIVPCFAWDLEELVNFLINFSLEKEPIQCEDINRVRRDRLEGMFGKGEQA